MGLTACTEPQCLYSRAIPLLPLWAYGLYRAPVPVQGCIYMYISHNEVCYILNKIVTYRDLQMPGNNVFLMHSSAGRCNFTHISSNTILCTNYRNDSTHGNKAVIIFKEYFLFAHRYCPTLRNNHTEDP
jgi:hypothetical protein